MLQVQWGEALTHVSMSGVRPSLESSAQVANARPMCIETTGGIVHKYIDIYVELLRVLRIRNALRTHVSMSGVRPSVESSAQVANARSRSGMRAHASMMTLAACSGTSLPALLRLRKERMYICK